MSYFLFTFLTRFSDVAPSNALGVAFVVVVIFVVAAILDVGFVVADVLVFGFIVDFVVFFTVVVVVSPVVFSFLTRTSLL